MTAPLDRIVDAITADPDTVYAITKDGTDVAVVISPELHDRLTTVSHPEEGP